MLNFIISALVLVAFTIAVHAIGLAMILRSVGLSPEALPRSPWPITWLLIHLAVWLIFIGCIEIAIWALFYLKMGLLADAESAFYFSGVTYTTIGYGDVVLSKPWRMLGPVQGLTGILMCSLSAALFFSVITRIYQSNREKSPQIPS